MPGGYLKTSKILCFGLSAYLYKSLYAQNLKEQYKLFGPIQKIVNLNA